MICKCQIVLTIAKKKYWQICTKKVEFVLTNRPFANKKSQKWFANRFATPPIFKSGGRSASPNPNLPICKSIFKSFTSHHVEHKLCSSCCITLSLCSLSHRHLPLCLFLSAISNSSVDCCIALMVVSLLTISLSVSLSRNRQQQRATATGDINGWQQGQWQGQQRGRQWRARATAMGEGDSKRWQRGQWRGQ